MQSGIPYLAQELHLGWVERIVFGKLQFGGEDAALEGSAFGALDEGFPDEEVVFIDRAGGDAVGRCGEEGFVFLEQALGGDRCVGHGGGCVDAVVLEN